MVLADKKRDIVISNQDFDFDTDSQERRSIMQELKDMKKYQYLSVGGRKNSKSPII